jgi:hypothetical protein
MLCWPSGMTSPRTFAPNRRTWALIDSSLVPCRHRSDSSEWLGDASMSWLIPILVLAALWNVGGVAAMLFQHATKAVAPSSKAAYQVDVGPTEMPWIGTLNLDMSWLGAPIYWFRYLRKRPRTWSVSVTRITKGSSLVGDLLREDFDSYREAQSRFRTVKHQIEVGELVLTG